MEELEEILDRLDEEPEESVEEKHRRLDEKLSEVHDQLALLDEHINNK